MRAVSVVTTTDGDSQPTPPGTRAGRTRAALLDAAETLFAERGFDGTRLEDVASRVGIRRASIVYYFKDKQALYEAVLDEVLGGLLSVIEPVLASPEPLPRRIETAVGAWVDYVGGRPSLARILLREVADTTSDDRPVLRRHREAFVDVVARHVTGRDDFDSSQFAPIDPVHVASTVVGATVFLVAAMPALVPSRGVAPLPPGELAAHRDEMVRTVRRLLTATD
jgi:TetR/AcrR family transcriptional regulator